MAQSKEIVLAHCKQVGEACEKKYGKLSAEALVGYTHDYIEDAIATAKEVEELWVSWGASVDAVLVAEEALAAISRHYGETYSEYIRRVGRNKVATHVKLIDLDVNMFRREHPAPSTLMGRYEKAVAYLEPLYED